MPNPSNEVADVVDLVSSDEDNAPAPSATLDTLPEEVPEDDDDLEVVSCKRAPPKGARPRQGEDASKDCQGATVDAGNQQSHPQSQAHTSTERHEPSARAAGSGVGGSSIGKTNGKKKGSKRKGAADGGDEVEFVGAKTVLDSLQHYPHFRFDCSIYPFRRQRVQRKQMMCERCFCYVCDIEASKCTEWMEHCKATSKSAAWRNMRKTLQDNRRKLASNLANAVDDPAKGTQFARFTTPVAVVDLATDADSDEDGTCTDVMQRTNWYSEGNQTPSRSAESALQMLLGGDEDTVVGDDLPSVVQRSESRISTTRGSAMSIDLP